MFNKTKNLRGIHTMKKLSLLVLFIWALSSCGNWNENPTKNININEELQSGEEQSEEIKDIIKNRCITDIFSQGQDDKLYGIDCIIEKQLVIKTSEEGDEISTSQSINGITLEEQLDFVNKVYQPSYQISVNEGDDKEIPFLRDLLPEDKRLLGSLNTEYKIIFETRGNYLVLFKASKNLNELPYIERTSQTKSKDGEFYMVPFLGYPIKYCWAEAIEIAHGQSSYKNRVKCQDEAPEEEDSSSQKIKYLQLQTTNAVTYQYLDKKDLLPKDYLAGEWFYNVSTIEQPNDEHLRISYANLVELNKKSNKLEMIDVSGDVDQRDRAILGALPIQWKEYEMNQNGKIFQTFGERTYEGQKAIDRPYMTINFSSIDSTVEVIDVLVTKNYFSYVIEVPYRSGGDIKKRKEKISFLRKEALDTKGFHPRRWFKDDHDHHFGVLPTAPQDALQEGEHTLEEQIANYRMIQFNTNLNTEEEIATKTKTIKWYFANTTTRNEEYRDIARTAVSVWNKAFEVITQNSDKKIRLQLIEEEKDLGDIRYNIINLIKANNLSGRSGLLGVAPSTANQNTGQIIGTTANVVIHNLERSYNHWVKNYIRHEIFHKHKKSEEHNKLHVLSPYLKYKIETLCPEVKAFISSKINTNIKPRDNLRDRHIILSCGRKISREQILHTTLHEMGHSLGLAHNFKATVDKDNYYQSLSEMKNYFPKAHNDYGEIPKSSSVMDYAVSDMPSLTVVGKYDLAALRFLYTAQVEGANGELVSLNIPQNPDEQREPLTNNSIGKTKKQYMHCSDFVQRFEDFLCTPFDYGSNPEEIATYHVTNAYRFFANNRYRYDSAGLSNPIERYLTPLNHFYQYWVNLSRNYLLSIAEKEKANYIFNDVESVERYKELIKTSVENSRDEEYSAYYPIRHIIPPLMLDYFFAITETMKCEVREGSSDDNQLLNLQDIRSFLLPRYGDNLYVEDCYSEQVINFFEENNLTLIKQRGMEEFPSYYSKGAKADLVDVLPVKQMIGFRKTKRERIPTSLPVNPRNILLEGVATGLLAVEPDIFHELKSRVEHALLDESNGKSDLEYLKIEELYISLFWNLNDMLIHNNTTKTEVIVRNNLEDISSVIFTTGTGDHSFYNRIMEPINDDPNNIDIINIPFLKDMYTKYEESGGFQGTRQNFQQYLLDSGKTIDDSRASKEYIIPYKTDSFVEKMIIKYNENTKKIQNYDNLENEKGSLSLLEKIKRKSIESHNATLKRAITKFIPEEYYIR